LLDKHPMNFDNGYIIEKAKKIYEEGVKIQEKRKTIVVPFHEQDFLKNKEELLFKPAINEV